MVLSAAIPTTVIMVLSAAAFSPCFLNGAFSYCLAHDEAHMVVPTVVNEIEGKWDWGILPRWCPRWCLQWCLYNGAHGGAHNGAHDGNGGAHGGKCD